jgi:hypothetical protein
MKIIHCSLSRELKVHFKAGLGTQSFKSTSFLMIQQSQAQNKLSQPNENNQTYHLTMITRHPIITTTQYLHLLTTSQQPIITSPHHNDIATTTSQRHHNNITTTSQQHHTQDELVVVH